MPVSERARFGWLCLRPVFYHCATRPQSATAARGLALFAWVQLFFEESGGTYGYRRIHADLAAEQTECSPAATSSSISKEFYNSGRRHSALGYRRPNDVHYGYHQPALAPKKNPLIPLFEMPAAAQTDSGGVTTGMFYYVLRCGSLCIPDGLQFDLRLRSAIRARNSHE